MAKILGIPVPNVNKPVTHINLGLLIAGGSLAWSWWLGSSLNTVALGIAGVFLAIGAGSFLLGRKQRIL